MGDRNFRQLLQNQWRRDRMVCVGLDPDWDRIPSSLKTRDGSERAPAEVLFDFNRRIIDATRNVAGAYKPQSAYFEKWGAPGFGVLKQTVEYLDQAAPETPRILDAKRGDGIDRCNRAYAEAIFGYLQFDAVTLHPYFCGLQALRPFLDHQEKGLIVLCRSSGPGGDEFQDLMVAFDDSELKDLLSGPVRSCADEEALASRSADGYRLVPLYKVVALRAANHWNEHGNCCLVVGATHPRDAQEIRRLVGDDVYFLVPGVGTQGGDVEASIKACRNSQKEGFILSSSSGIIHASSGSDFADRAREKAIELNEAINRYRKE